MLDVQTRSVVFRKADGTRVEVGSDGLGVLVAYAGAVSAPDLLRSLSRVRALGVAHD